MRREVVITGYGIVCALGRNVDAFATALAESRCGVAPFESVPGAPAFAAAVKGELAAAPGLFARDRKVALALHAAQEAWERAGRPQGNAALSLGIGLEQAHLEDFANPPPPPTRLYRSPVDFAADAVTAQLGLQGPRFVHVSACAAGTMALGHGAALIRRGRAQIVVAGATDSMLNPLGLVGMARLGAPAKEACRPFDRRRDGLAMGEGAAIFVLEDAEHAEKRGARVHARILGYAATQDGYRVTAPRPDGERAAAAMAAAIADAGLKPRAIGYINAHGTGTPLNDVAETRAIRSVFGAHAGALPVSSIKGAIGHGMAAAGALEAVACVIALSTGIIPGTVGCEQLDPECNIAVLGPRAESLSVHNILSSSFGFGGQNACIVLGSA